MNIICMSNQTKMQVTYIFITQNNLIHTVKVIKIQPNKMDSEMIKLYLSDISLSNIFKIHLQSKVIHFISIVVLRFNEKSSG